MWTNQKLSGRSYWLSSWTNKNVWSNYFLSLWTNQKLSGIYYYLSFHCEPIKISLGVTIDRHCAPTRNCLIVAFTYHCEPTKICLGVTIDCHCELTRNCLGVTIVYHWINQKLSESYHCELTRNCLPSNFCLSLWTNEE